MKDPKAVAFVLFLAGVVALAVMSGDSALLPSNTQEWRTVDRLCGEGLIALTEFRRTGAEEDLRKWWALDQEIALAWKAYQAALGDGVTIELEEVE